MKPYVVPYLFIFLHPSGIICIPRYILQYFVYLFRHCAFKFSSWFIKQLNNLWPCDMNIMFHNLFNIFANQLLDLIKFMQPF